MTLRVRVPKFMEAIDGLFMTTVRVGIMDALFEFARLKLVIETCCNPFIPVRVTVWLTGTPVRVTVPKGRVTTALTVPVIVKAAEACLTNPLTKVVKGEPFPASVTVPLKEVVIWVLLEEETGEFNVLNVPMSVDPEYKELVSETDWVVRGVKVPRGEVMRI